MARNYDRTARLQHEFEQLRRYFVLNMTNFLITDLDLGNTFVRGAKSDSEEKTARNRKNARKAYDAVLHFLDSAELAPEARIEIEDRLAALKSDLQSLGETF